MHCLEEPPSVAILQHGSAGAIQSYQYSGQGESDRRSRKHSSGIVRVLILDVVEFDVTACLQVIAEVHEVMATKTSAVPNDQQAVITAVNPLLLREKISSTCVTFALRSVSNRTPLQTEHTPNFRREVSRSTKIFRSAVQYCRIYYSPAWKDAHAYPGHAATV